MYFILLGIFDSVFNWVYNKMIGPVFNQVSSWISSGLDWVFKNLLTPVLQTVMEFVFPILWEILMALIADFLYGILCILFRLIDAVQMGFDILIGLRNVRYTPVGGTTISVSLLEALFSQSVIGNAFFGISIAAVALAFIAAIYATIRSTLDFDMENRRPVGQVMKAFFKSGLTFLLVPLLVLFMINLSAVILRTFDTAMGGTGGSMGRTIFLVSTLDAGKVNIASPSFDDALRQPYWTGAKDYTNIVVVKQNFDLTKIDYFTAFAASIFVLIVMAMCIIIFVQRIFEILLLYIVAPFFVAAMPIDDGERFGKWREAFIGKVFSGFGAAIAMRLYLMVIPVIMTSGFAFGSATGTMDYVIKLLFVLGGAWAVYKSSSMLTSLLSFQAAQSEASAGAMVAGAAGSVAAAGGGMVASAGRDAFGMLRDSVMGRQQGQQGGAGGQQGGGGGGQRFALARRGVPGGSLGGAYGGRMAPRGDDRRLGKPGGGYVGGYGVPGGAYGGRTAPRGQDGRLGKPGGGYAGGYGVPGGAYGGRPASGASPAGTAPRAPGRPGGGAAGAAPGAAGIPPAGGDAAGPALGTARDAGTAPGGRGGAAGGGAFTGGGGRAGGGIEGLGGGRDDPADGVGGTGGALPGSDGGSPARPQGAEQPEEHGGG
ncbi:MAG: hypothetical protein LBJ10_06470 [Clostridiales bacterium]|nr:hypothetical protein [Clostridiales bacterium]